MGLNSVSKLAFSDMTFAHRMDHLKTEGAYKVLARAQALEDQGKHIIHLEIREPDFQTPPNVSMAGICAIATGQTRYHPPPGMVALREKIAQYRARAVWYIPGQYRKASAG